jgi:hypothetical protein
MSERAKRVREKNFEVLRCPVLAKGDRPNVQFWSRDLDSPEVEYPIEFKQVEKYNNALC